MIAEKYFYLFSNFILLKPRHVARIADKKRSPADQENCGAALATCKLSLVW
jgi:hypothetical protein